MSKHEHSTWSETKKKRADSHRSIYLAGPMRGLFEHNYPTFHEAEGAIRFRCPDAKIFNPARAFGGDTTKDIRDYFAADFTFLLTEADSIVFLPGWEGSEGSLIEFGIARALGLDFAFLERNLELEVGHSLELPKDAFHKASEWPEHAPVAYEAHRLVFGDRGASYGHPDKNFNDIAAVWNAQLSTNSIDAVEVANMMTLFKIARSKSSYKRDNIIDAIGYQVAAQRVVDGK